MSVSNLPVIVGFTLYLGELLVNMKVAILSYYCLCYLVVQCPCETRFLSVYCVVAHSYCHMSFDHVPMQGVVL